MARIDGQVDAGGLGLSPQREPPSPAGPQVLASVLNALHALGVIGAGHGERLYHQGWGFEGFGDLTATWSASTRYEAPS